MQILLKEVPTNGKPPSLEPVQRDQLNTANQWGLQTQLQQINKHELLRRHFPIQDVTLNVALFVPLATIRPQTPATELLVHAHNKPAPIFGEQFLCGYFTLRGDFEK